MKKPVLSRRMLAVSVLAAGSLAVLFSRFDWYDGFKIKRFLSDEFAQIFGPKIAESTAARQFLADYFRFFAASPVPIGRNELTLAFLQSSNVMEHHETGIELAYDQLFDPYKTPCGNHLGAGFDFAT